MLLDSYNFQAPGFYQKLGAELLEIAGEASALHKFLTDILEEGYTATVNRLIEQTDAMHRLQRFLSIVLPRLGGPSERERFYLFPDLIPLPQVTPNFRRGMQSKSGSWGRFSVLPASAR